MNGEPSVSAFAPATIAGFGPGLGVIGLALDGPGNIVTARLEPGNGVRVNDDDGGAAAAAAAQATLRQAGVDAGVTLEIARGIPAAAGLGGTAASVVAAAYAVNLLIGSPLRKVELMSACLGAIDDQAAIGADSIAPALLGGLILVHAVDPLDLIRLPVPEGLTVVAVTPRFDPPQEDGRALAVATALPELSASIAHASALVAACHSGDLALLGRALHGTMAAPARAPAIPGRADAVSAALDAGALGCSIVGHGPSMIALCRSPHSASEVAAAMVAAFGRAGVDSSATVSAADCPGVRRVSR